MDDGESHRKLSCEQMNPVKVELITNGCRFKLQKG